MSEVKIKYSPDEVIIKLKKMIKMIENVNANIHGEISHAQARVIFPILKNQQGYTIQELANIGGFAKSFVSRTIASLESKGYVERDKKTQDQDRNYKIVISKKGQELVSATEKNIRDVSKKFDGKITPEDLETFVRVLDIFAETN